MGVAVKPIIGISEEHAKSNLALQQKRTIIEGFARTRMPTAAQFRKASIIGMVTALWLAFGLCAAANAGNPPDSVSATDLDHGFIGLYNLDFTGAQKDFSSWE